MQRKIDDILAKNTGYKTLNIMSKIMNREFISILYWMAYLKT